MEEVTDEPLYRDRVCGIDIGKAGLAATIRVPSDKDPPTLMFLAKEAVRLATAAPPPASPARAARRSLNWSSATRPPAGDTTSARSASTPRNSARNHSSAAPNSRAQSRCGRGSATRPPPPSATDPRRPPAARDVRPGAGVSVCSARRPRFSEGSPGGAEPYGPGADLPPATSRAPAGVQALTGARCLPLIGMSTREVSESSGQMKQRRSHLICTVAALPESDPVAAQAVILSRFEISPGGGGFLRGRHVADVRLWA